MMEQPGLHWSERAIQGAGYGPVPRMPTAVAPARTQSGRRRAGLIIGAAAALVVIAAAATTILLLHQRDAAEANRQAIALALSQMTDYIDDEHNVMFKYPSSWVQVPADELGRMGSPTTVFAAFGDPFSGDSGAAPATYMIFAGEEHPGGSDLSARSVLEETMEVFDKYAPEGFSIVEDVSEIDTNGIRGAQTTFSYEDAAQSLVVRMCFLGEGDFFYVFMFGADKQDWDKNERFFDATIESFVAGSA